MKPNTKTLQKYSTKSSENKHAITLRTLKKFVNAGSSTASVAEAAAEDDSTGLSGIIDTGWSSTDSLQYIKK